MKKKKIGIIGCGAIGSRLAGFIHADLRRQASLVSLCDPDSTRVKHLIARHGLHASIDPIKTLIQKSDLVIEAASASVVPLVLKEAAGKHKDVFIMSVGGLLVSNSLLRAADRRGISVYVPSGAICGLDGLKAAAAGTIKKITLSTYKPPQGLVDSPFVRARKIPVHSFKKETRIFKGSVREAVRYFPQNINVAALLYFCSRRSKKIEVNIFITPRSRRNVHKLRIDCDSGTLLTEVHNIPSTDNVKTSMLAVRSAMAALRGIFTTVKIGT